MGNDRQTIDRIVYMASLVSNTDAVDPMLDTLRIITAKHTSAKPGEFLSTDERHTLSNLQDALTNHLTTKDPVRAFTNESLQLTVDRHFATVNPASRARRVVIRQVFAVLGIAFLVLGLGLALIPGDMSFRFAISMSAFLTTISLGIAWLFLSARRELAPALQKTYAFLALGLITSSVNSAQYPLYGAFPELEKLPVFQYSGMVVPFVIAYLFMYLGFYVYAKQLGDVKLGVAHPKVVAAIAAAGVILAVLAPHPAPVPHEIFFDISLSAFWLSLLLSSMAGILGFKIVSRITKRYAQAQRLFSISLLVFAVVCGALGTLLFTSGLLAPTDIRAAGLSVLFLVAQILQISSAYLFKRNIQD